MSRLPRARHLLLALSGSLALTTASASAANVVVEDWHGTGGSAWQQGAATDFIGWASASSDGTFDFSKTDLTGRGSLLAEAQFLPQQASGTGEWRFTAPGTSTITKAEYGAAYFTKEGCVNEGMRLARGAWQPTRNARPGDNAAASTHPTACGANSTVTGAPVTTKDGATAVTITGAPGRQTFCSTTGCAITGSPIGNRAVFGAERIKQGRPGFGVVLPGARLTLTDYDVPKLTGATNSHPRWVRSARGQVKVTATDTGLGVKTASVTHAAIAGDVTDSQTHPCLGDRTDRCPATWNEDRPDWTTNWPYDTDAMPEGVQRYGVAVRDIVENRTPASGYDTALLPPSKIDRSAPDPVTADGTLTDVDDRWIRGEDTKRITVVAHDRYSGVQKVTVQTDRGTVLDSVTSNCDDDQCPRDVTGELAVDTTQLPEGVTRVFVRVDDLVGNTTDTATLSLKIDRSLPSSVTASGELTFGTDGYFTTRQPAALRLDASDARSADGQTLSGIASVALVDETGQALATHTASCTPGQCPETAGSDLSVDLSSLGEGVHRLHLVATDAVGRETTSAVWEIYIDNSAPALTEAITGQRDENDVLVTWASDDPELPGGVAGVGEQSAAIRYRDTTAGDWSEWATPDGYSYLAAITATSVEIQLQLVDRLGNEQTVSQVLQVEPPEPFEPGEDPDAVIDDELFDCGDVCADEEPETFGRRAAFAATAYSGADWGFAGADTPYWKGAVDEPFIADARISRLADHVRYLVPYDIFNHSKRLKALDDVMDYASASGTDVMISFEVGCKDNIRAVSCNGSSSEPTRTPPSGKKLNAIAYRLMARYKGILKYIGVWNEPSHENQPFGGKLGNLQDITRALSRGYPKGKTRWSQLTAAEKQTVGVCARYKCEVVSAEVEIGIGTYLRYAQWLTAHKSEMPRLKYYGAHDYPEVADASEAGFHNSMTRTKLNTWMKALPANAQVWLPEIGVFKRKANKTEPGKQEEQAAWLFNKMAKFKASNGARVAKASYYQTCPSVTYDWDTSLFNDANELYSDGENPPRQHQATTCVENRTPRHATWQYLDN